MSLKISFVLLLAFTLSSCLKTRDEVGEDEQSQVYSKKNADNQSAAKNQSQAQQQLAPAVDERDELIRTLNGRVENLETQLTTLSKDKEKSTAPSEESQKIQLLQEALSKMELQIQKLEAEKKVSETPVVEAAPVGKASSKNAATTSKKIAPTASYDTAQDFFMKKEWKKAILSYQKYVDEAPKGVNLADAKYKIGVCFQELGMKEESMAFYEEVVANYAKSEAGKKAKLRLAKIKK